MKQKKTFTSLDVTAMVNSLQSKIVGMRLANIFDVNAKQYIFKFAKNERKECLVIESGVRFHTTTAQIQKSKMPSGFTMKFRKFLRSKRLESLQQVGMERVVDMKFGTDDHCYHIILEFYAQGNIIMTNKDYVIIQLVRSHEFNEEAKTSINEIYPFAQATKLYLENFDSSENAIKKLLEESEEINQSGKQEDASIADIIPASIPAKQDKKKKINKQPVQEQKVKGTKFKEIIFKMLPCYHPQLAEHFVKENGFNPNMNVSYRNINDIQHVANIAFKFLKDFSCQKQFKGYLIAQDIAVTQLNQAKISQDTEEKTEEKKILYTDFTPFLFSHQKDKNITEFDSFDQALDVYFAQVIQEQKQVEQSNKAWKKYENIKQDQQNRIQKLRDNQEDYLVKAQLIEENISDVDALITIIETIVNGGISWDRLTKMINEAKKNGDPLANIIYAQDWKESVITLLLGSVEESQEQMGAAMETVEISTKMSVYQNLQHYYQMKKQFLRKEEKTLEATSQALKIAEKNAITQQQQNQQNNKKEDKFDVLNQRKTFYFEKFYWFISSENYLVISGKDVGQNELIVKKYLAKDDIYIHADFHGAASTVIKNHDPSVKVPEQTLMEAAVQAVCRSKAWDAKILADAWWVYAHQVSKAAPTGLFLPAGSFMIRGKKNFLHPQRLEMGFAILFYIDPSCLEWHLGDRVNRETQQKEDQQYESGAAKLEGLVQQAHEGSDNFEVVNMIPAQQSQQPNQAQNKAPKQNMQQQKQPLQQQQQAPKIKAHEQVQDNVSQSSSSQPVVLTAKQKNKLKRLKKYEEQTEEERNLKLKLLGAKPMKRQVDSASVDQSMISISDNNKGSNLNQQVDNINDKSQNTHANDSISKHIKTEKAEMSKHRQNKQKFYKKHQEQLENNVIAKQDNPAEKQKQIAVEQYRQKQEAKEGNQVLTSKQLLPEDDEQILDALSEEGENKNGNGSNEEDEDEFKRNQAQQETQNLQEQNVPLPVIERNELSRFVGNPIPDKDVYYYCLPMIAPFISLMSNYKYKTKLLPGNLKKGKSAKAIVNYLLAQKDINPVDRRLIKNISDVELVNNMIGNVKVAAAGIQKIKDSEKNAKKQAKKQADAEVVIT